MPQPAEGTELHSPQSSLLIAPYKNPTLPSVSLLLIYIRNVDAGLPQVFVCSRFLLGGGLLNSFGDPEHGNQLFRGIEELKTQFSVGLVIQDDGPGPMRSPGDGAILTECLRHIGLLSFCGERGNEDAPPFALKLA